jgi:hypothetical protein
MPQHFPAVLFARSAALSFALGITEWSVRRRLARYLFALGGFSLLCLVANRASARNSIRVDLLFTIPAVS